MTLVSAESGRGEAMKNQHVSKNNCTNDHTLNAHNSSVHVHLHKHSERRERESEKEIEKERKGASQIEGEKCRERKRE